MNYLEIETRSVSGFDVIEYLNSMNKIAPVVNDLVHIAFINTLKRQEQRKNQ